MTGILYIVATPIGNLGDMTARAVEILQSADLIASEDTRHSSILLSRWNISKPQVAYHDFNKETCAPRLVEQMKEGKNIALLSDAGTPGIADPAFLLVRLCIASDIPVVPLPGPCAAITALCVSGLPTDRFVFENFAPSKKGRRTRMLESLKQEERTVILYESPHRLVALLEDMLSVYGDIRVVVARELTKKFEEILRKPLSEMIAHFTSHPPKGEITVLFNLRHAKITPSDSPGSMPGAPAKA